MTERAFARASRKHELEDLRRLEAAAEAIARDSNLRFLFARLFESCGMAASPFTPDPLTTAHACGKMAVGEELRALLETASPDLYFDIMKEQAHAERQRTDELQSSLAVD